jgi:MinD-like ATPase involved in chromosome partitioning or flagellar assembly
VQRLHTNSLQGAAGAPCDQAAGLRRLLTKPTVRALLVVGHAESDWVAAMLAEALVALGERVLLIDQGLGTCHQHLGIAHTRSLEDLVAGRCKTDDAIVATPSGLQVALVRDDFSQLKRIAMSTGNFLGGLAGAPEPADLVLIHFSNPAAIARLMDSEAEILLTTGADQGSMQTTYLNIKRTCARLHRYRVVVVGDDKNANAAAVHERIAATARRFLGIAPDFEGAVPSANSRSRAGIPSTFNAAFAQLASRVMAWRLPEFPVLHAESDLLSVQN